MKLERRIKEIGAVACFIDTSADAFGGDEINRHQVRQFVGLLRGIAIRNHTTPVLLSHPSLSGMASGSGTSGSTGWNNSARSRLYFEGDDKDPDARVLKFMKSNYGPKAKPMRLRWQNGLFVPIAKDENAIAATELAKEAAFLAMLDAYTAQGRRVSSKPSSSYAPTVFAADKALANGLTKSDLANGMNALFAKKQIISKDEGPPSRRVSYIARS